jgi:hypothetical protein
VKKLLTLALVLVLALAVPAVVLGQGITYSSAFQVQNLGTEVANITIIFYNKDGSTAATVNDTIAIGGSNTYNVARMSQVPTPFDGSVVISSNVPVAAISNESGNSGAFGASYAGFRDPPGSATTAYLPLIMRGNGGFNTWFNVQNAGSADANVTVTYTPVVRGGTPIGNSFTETATIKPGAAHTFDQAALAGLGARFVGSVKVTSNQAIVATVNEVGPTTLMAYDGFSGGSTRLSFPLVNTRNAGYETGIQIMNIGTQDTTVTMHYTWDPAKGSGAVADEVKLVPAGGSTTFAGPFFTSRFVGSGLVTANSASQLLVGVVNQLNAHTSKGAAYNGFDPDSSAVTNQISFPLVMAKNNGYGTGIVIQNVGAASTTINVAYTGGTSVGPYTLGPGEGKIIAQDPSFASRYVGSATVTASAGGKIVGMCNELNNSTNVDTFLVYEGFNY